MLRWALALGRTPRELLAAVTSADIVEMIAYANLEPFGALADDFRAGQLCATLANVHRDPKARAHAWTAADFMPALARESAALRPEPLLLADPRAQAELIKRSVFGVRGNG